MEWISVEEKLPPPHETVLALAHNGDVYQARVCYGMHAPFWCGHSTLNFGVIFRKKDVVIKSWAPHPGPNQATPDDAKSAAE